MLIFVKMRYYSLPELIKVTYCVNIAPNSKFLEVIAMKKFLLLSLTVLSVGLFAELSPGKIAEIEQNVSSMGVKELIDRRSFLLSEDCLLYTSDAADE